MELSHRRYLQTAAAAVIVVGALVAWRVRRSHGTREASRPGVHRAVPQVEGRVEWNGRPLAGATVQAQEQPDARTTTASDGTFSLSLPVGATRTVRVSLAGYRTVQSMVVVGASNFDFELPPNDLATSTYAAVHLTEDPALGALMVQFEGTDSSQRSGYGVTQSVPGGTRFVSPDSGPKLQETVGAEDGSLIIANVPVGTVDLTPVVPVGTCTPLFGTATVRVDPHTITSLTFVCRSHAPARRTPAYRASPGDAATTTDAATLTDAATTAPADAPSDVSNPG